MLIEKAMAESNLDVYEKTRRLIEDQICPAGTDRPEYPKQIQNHQAWAQQAKHDYDTAIR